MPNTNIARSPFTRLGPATLSGVATCFGHNLAALPGVQKMRVDNYDGIVLTTESEEYAQALDKLIADRILGIPVQFRTKHSPPPDKAGRKNREEAREKTSEPTAASYDPLGQAKRVAQEYNDVLGHFLPYIRAVRPMVEIWPDQPPKPFLSLEYSGEPEERLYLSRLLEPKIDGVWLRFDETP